MKIGTDGKKKRYDKVKLRRHISNELYFETILTTKKKSLGNCYFFYNFNG